MSCRLVQRGSARRDILAIIDHITDDNPAAAEAVYEAYEHSLELLKSTPDMGRVYDSDNPRLAGIRFITIHRYSNYLLFYRRTEAVVDVLHVWHGADGRSRQVGAFLRRRLGDAHLAALLLAPGVDDPPDELVDGQAQTLGLDMQSGVLRLGEPDHDARQLRAHGHSLYHATASDVNKTRTCAR